MSRSTQPHTRAHTHSSGRRGAPLLTQGDPGCPACFSLACMRFAADPRKKGYILLVELPSSSSFLLPGAWDTICGLSVSKLETAKRYGRSRGRAQNNLSFFSVDFPLCLLSFAEDSFLITRVVRNGRLLNPNRAVRIFGEINDSTKRYYNFEEWELPEGAQAQLNQGEASILLPNETDYRSMRIFGRLARSEAAPNYINP